MKNHGVSRAEIDEATLRMLSTIGLILAELVSLVAPELDDEDVVASGGAMADAASDCIDLAERIAQSLAIDSPARNRYK